MRFVCLSLKQVNVNDSAQIGLKGIRSTLLH